MKCMFFSWGPHRGNHRFLWVILNVWLSFWAHRTSAQVSVVPAVVNTTVGHNVTLHVQVSGTIRSYNWYRGAGTNAENQILGYFPASAGPQVNGSQHTGRETGLSNGSLHITNARMTDTGLYTVTVQTLVLSQASGQLRVYAMLSQPTLTNTSKLEFVDKNITLQCLKHGNETVERYTFSKDNLGNPCEHANITCNGSSLYFHPIYTSNNGNYTCTVHNPVSSNTSAALEIRVKPVSISNVTISSNVTPGVLQENKDSVQLTCSALGTEPVFSWAYNWTLLTPNPRYHLSPGNSSLTISPVTRNDTGPFVCTASNSISNQSSQPMYLNISWPPDGSIQCRAGGKRDWALLSCSWPGGQPPATVRLFVPPNINVSGAHEIMHNVSLSNITAEINQTCSGSQDGQTQECALGLVVPEDPDFVNDSITAAKEGKDVQLMVNLGRSSRASSMETLPATFSWFNSSSANIISNERLQINSTQFSSQLMISRVTQADSGSYLCLAVNFMGTTSFHFKVNVSRVPEAIITPTSGPGDKGLSAGAITGIVLGVLALLVLIGVVVYVVLKKKKGKKLGNSPDGARHQPAEIPYTNMNSKSNAHEAANAMQLQETPQKDDVNYAALKFNNNQCEPPPTDYPGAMETMYAEVKKN